ncbi:MAG: UDP-N-acetylmuramoyl-L-alanyl-D-glutamate--2,6-diaminopimelate ligase [Firmicutes bacterium]|nr:UDP-N-acetylmuramoyl-L-alanyl-D-glutamate--2,6-diaminopimelate ligase [Bacillota bacterium]
MEFTAIINALEPYICGVTGRENPICGLTCDSRQVEPGFAFAAIPGGQQDGHDFIAEAVGRGAALILAEREAELPAGVSLIRVGDSRRALAALAAAFYGYPDRGLGLIGVTGTNGKTTTAHLVKYLLERSGRPCGLIGTLGAWAGGEKLADLDSASTTPESPELFRLFAQMRERGCERAVIEASSHALEQGRTSACRFQGAVFTNLTQDHLDYHKTMEAYGQAKATLFSQLNELGWGAVNLDDKYAACFTQACRCRLYTYGETDRADLRLLQYSASMKGMDFTVSWEGRSYPLHIPFVGRFNIYNALAALCAGLGEDLDLADMADWLAEAPQIPGRFELIDEGQSFAVVVDYAHTPDGLENLLRTVRSLKPRRVITVFGCGGDRDTGKRPLMGRIAGQYSDVTVLTSDNPRFEDPQAILEMVEAGIREVCNNYLVEERRERAIPLALNMAQTGDIVVIAGKGHEDYQLIQGVSHHFDDREQARAALRARIDQ